MYYLIIFYLVGVLLDFITVLFVRFVSKEKIIPATILSFVSVLLGMLVIYNIVAKLQAQESIIAIVVYALGMATGTFLAMKMKKWFKD